VLISFSSLLCWVKSKTNFTPTPRRVLDLKTLTVKEPSPEVKPAIQLESLIFWSLMFGLATATTSVKANFSLSGRPKFMEALMATIFF